MDRIKPYFSFRGRTNRLRYWLTTLSIYALSLGLSFTAYVVNGVTGMGAAFALLALALDIPLAVAGLALMVRRLHDRNRSGWFALIFAGIPACGIAAQAWFAEDDPILALIALVVLLVVIWGLVELAILKGTAGPNRFGEDPLPIPPEPALGMTE